MGNSKISKINTLTPSNTIISSTEYNNLPFFNSNIHISPLIIIGFFNNRLSIKYYDSVVWHFAIIAEKFKEKNYTDLIFNDKSSLIIYNKDQTTCSESEINSNDSYFIFDSSYIKTNGKVKENIDLDKVL